MNQLYGDGHVEWEARGVDLDPDDLQDINGNRPRVDPLDLFTYTIY